MKPGGLQSITETREATPEKRVSASARPVPLGICGENFLAPTMDDALLVGLSQVPTSGLDAFLAAFDALGGEGG